MIELKQVSKIYQNNNQQITAVNNINLTIASGEIFGIIGYSGAGKSSLIRLFNQLEKPTSGSIIIDGIDISQASGANLRKARQSIGMVFQHFNLLWSRTVAQNIAFPLEIAGITNQQKQLRVQELIELVGLQGRENAYPNQLSGGQKQRVGIARALANNPKLLLCDEATSALDPRTTDSILDLLLDINKKLKLTIVLITHEMHVVRKICDRVAVIEQGKIVEQGEVLEIFSNPQQEITKGFVQQITDFEQGENITDLLLSQITDGVLLKLSFIGKDTLNPLISEIARKFSLDISILQGRITYTTKGVIGTLYVHVGKSQTEQLTAVIKFIQQHDVTVEVIKNA